MATFLSMIIDVELMSDKDFSCKKKIINLYTFLKTGFITIVVKIIFYTLMFTMFQKDIFDSQPKYVTHYVLSEL